MRTPPTTVFIALTAAAASAAAWIFWTALHEPPPSRTISAVAWSRTGKWTVAGTAQGGITLLNPQPGAAPAQFDFPAGQLNHLQFSPDEHLLAVAGRDLALYALDHPTPPRFLRADGRNYGDVRFTRDQQTVLTITGTGAIELLDAQSGAARLTICCSTVYGEVAFTPDERAIANAGHSPRLWDARSGQLIAQLTKERAFHAFGPIAFDPARGTILMGSQDGRVYCWDLATHQLIAQSPPHPEYVNTIAVTGKGLVAYAGFDGMVRLWNPQTGQERALTSARPTSNLAIGPDGATLLFGTADRELESWDTAAGPRLRALRLH